MSSRADRKTAAVMGCGNWGRNLVRALSGMKSAELRWIADPDPKALELARALAPHAGLCEDVSLALGEVDLVFVATPSRAHAVHVGALLAHGKDVFVEKPFAMSVEDADSLAEQARAAGAVVMAGHQLLYHPKFRALEALVEKGALGRLRSIRAERTGVLDFDREPGVLWAYGPHDVAMVLKLAGESPDKVRAAGSTRNGKPDTAESASIHLGFESGLSAEIRLACENSRRRRFEVEGDERIAVFDDAQPGGRLTLFDKGAVSGEEVAARPDEPLFIECSHFVECAFSRAAPVTGLPHAVEVTRILAAAAGGFAATGCGI